MIYRSAGYKPYLWNNNLVSALLLLITPIMLFFLIMGLTFSFTFIFPVAFMLLAAFFITCFTSLIVILAGHPLPKADKNQDFSLDLTDKIDEIFYSATSASFNYAWEHLPYIFGISISWIAFTWFFNSWFIHKTTGAKPVTRKEEFKLYNLLENLAISVGIPSPSLAIIETKQINAFSSGLDKRNYTVIITRGLIDRLQKDELEAVLAHELTHICNGDTRLMMITSILFFVPNKSSKIFNGSFWVTSDRELSWFYKYGGAFILIPVEMWIRMVIALFMFILNGAATHFSYKRDLVADIGSAELTQNPAALAKALLKGQDASFLSDIPQRMAGIFFLPISRSQKQETHIPEDSRIQALKDFGNHFRLGLIDSDYQLSKRDKRQALAAAKHKIEGSRAPLKKKSARTAPTKANPITLPTELLPAFGNVSKPMDNSLTATRTSHPTAAVTDTNSPPRKTFGLRQAKN